MQGKQQKNTLSFSYLCTYHKVMMPKYKTWLYNSESARWVAAAYGGTMDSYLNTYIEVAKNIWCSPDVHAARSIGHLP